MGFFLARKPKQTGVQDAAAAAVPATPGARTATTRQRGNAAAQLHNEAMESLDELTPQDVFARRLAQESVEPPLQQALTDRYQAVVQALTAADGDGEGDTA